MQKPFFDIEDIFLSNSCPNKDLVCIILLLMYPIFYYLSLYRNVDSEYCKARHVQALLE